MENKTISGYTLLHKLGTGGMAEVWYAKNKLGKSAAVKILSKGLCVEQNIIERFEKEARIMVKLHHPNIRQVYDYGMIEDRSCIIMEYLEGEDLGSLIKKRTVFTQAQIVRWWNQMVSALNYTHQQGIVHRDIKPSNIFITSEGNVELLDFGISKVEDNYLSTLSGMSMGTPMYMSPEQVVNSKHVDYRSDLYSLAVTFVHLLRGKAPYSSELSVYSLHKSIVEESLDMNGIPQEWQNLLSPYLAKKPEERPLLREFQTREFGSKEYTDETFVDVGQTKVEEKIHIKELNFEVEKKHKSKKWIIPTIIIIVLSLVWLLYCGLNGYPRSHFGRSIYKIDNCYELVENKSDKSLVDLIYKKELLFGVNMYQLRLCGYSGIYHVRKIIRDDIGGGFYWNSNKSLFFVKNTTTNKKALTNSYGAFITDFIFDSFGADFERVTLKSGESFFINKVCIDGKWGLIDSFGNFVLPAKYDEIKDYEKGPGKTKVRIGKRWSSIDY